MEKNLNQTQLLEKSKDLRIKFIKLLHEGYKFHVGGTLSCFDIMITLFYSNFVNLKKKKRNLFILSKGHALACFFFNNDRSKTLLIKKI